MGRGDYVTARLAQISTAFSYQIQKMLRTFLDKAWTAQTLFCIMH